MATVCGWMENMAAAVRKCNAGQPEKRAALERSEMGERTCGGCQPVPEVRAALGQCLPRKAGHRNRRQQEQSRERQIRVLPPECVDQNLYRRRRCQDAQSGPGPNGAEAGVQPRVVPAGDQRRAWNGAEGGNPDSAKQTDASLELPDGFRAGGQRHSGGEAQQPHRERALRAPAVKEMADRY